MKSLILDIDHTMVYSDMLGGNKDIVENSFKVQVGDKNILVHKRPFLLEFLRMVSDHFDIYSYTSGGRDYANAILDQLEFEVGSKIFKGRYSNEHCEYLFIPMPWGGSMSNSFKDISKLGFEKKTTIVLDDSTDVYRKQFYNVIRIRGYTGDEKDDHLDQVLPFILSLKDAVDVRPEIKKYNEKQFPSVYEEKTLIGTFFLNPLELDEALK